MGQKIKFPVIEGKKECSKCRERKPVAEFGPREGGYESQCRGCKALYRKAYLQRPECRARSLEYSRKYRADPTNRERQNANTRRYMRSREAMDRKNKARREWAAIEKQKAVDYKGGSCVCCGYNSCLAAMDFHHRDPSEKEGYGTGALKQHWTFERNKPELDKCELVCVRCHREIHAGIRTLPTACLTS